MKRRKFIALMGGVTVWPLGAFAQQSKMRRVGVLLIGNADKESFQKELREGLRELGHIEGQDILFEFRSAEENLSRLPELAAELVRLKVDVIVALYTPCGLAAKEATRDIPIVLLTGDPLGTGLVTSLDVHCTSAWGQTENHCFYRHMSASASCGHAVAYALGGFVPLAALSNRSKEQATRSPRRQSFV